MSNALPEKHGFSELIVWTNEEILKVLPKYDFIKYIKTKHKNSITGLIWQKYQFANEAKKLKCEVLFFPGGIYLGNFKPYVSLSQSMLPFDKQARNLYKGTALFWILRIKEKLMLRTFRKANGIIFVSNAIKKQVEKINGKELKNSTVIYHGVNKIFLRNKRRKKDSDGSINILTVSSHARHKNLVTIVKKITEIKNDGFNIKLKIVGPETKYGTKQLYDEIDKVDPNNSFIEVITNAEYEDLPVYYNEADIFVASSLCESFGLPLKEAIANNIPILYQKLDSFKEIILSNNSKPICKEFDFTKDDLKDKILEMLNKKNKYIINQNEISWEKCVWETFNFTRKNVNN